MGGCASSNNASDTSNDVTIFTENEGEKQEDKMTPEVGFCLKTKNGDGVKVFINVFHYAQVQYMLTQPMKMSTDKAGESCCTFDVVINTGVITTLASNNEAKIYICEQLLQHLNSTYSESLDANFKFPKMKRGYVGDDVPHFSLEVVAEAANDERKFIMARPVGEVQSELSKQQELILENDKSTPISSCVYSGNLMKKSASSFVGWQPRYFHLSEAGILAYYEKEADFKSNSAPKGNINLSEMTSANRAALISEAPHDPTCETKLMVVVGTRTFEMEAETLELVNQWKAHFSVFFESI